MTASETGPTDVVVAYYEQLLAGEPYLAQALCWTVLPGRRSVPEILARIGTGVTFEESASRNDVTALQSADYRAGGSYRALCWLIESDAALMLLEDNGFAGSVPETLAALSYGGHRAVSMYWCDANGANHLSAADDGVVDFVNLDVPRWLHPEDHPLLGPFLGPLLDHGDDDSGAPWEAGLAVVEAMTGVRLLPEHLAGPWPLVSFRPWETTPERPPGPLGHRDPELALLIAEATAEQRWPIERDLAHRVAKSVGLAEVPAIAQLLADFDVATDLDGHRRLLSLAIEYQDVSSLPEDGRVDVRDPAWRRRQAVMAIAELTSHSMFDERWETQGWLSATYALLDDWAEARAAAVAAFRRILA